MPTITPQSRPQAASNEAEYRAPVKTIQAGSTGMTIQKREQTTQNPQQTAPKIGQSAVAEETTDTKAATLSPQLSAFARKEAKFRQEQAAFQRQKADFESQNPKFEKFKNLDERITKKDFDVLDELGVSYKEWGDYLRAKQQGQRPEVQAIKKIEDKLNKLEENQQQNVSKQYEATVNQYRADVKALVAKDPQFSTIKELGREEFVVQHILDTFEQDGEILTIDDASKEIEDALVEEAEKVAGISKIKAKQQAQPPEKKLPLPTRSGLRQQQRELPPEPQEFARGKGQLQYMSPADRVQAAIQRAQRQG